MPPSPLQAVVGALGSAAEALSGVQLVPLLPHQGSRLPAVLAGGCLSREGFLSEQQDESRAARLWVADPLCPSDSPVLSSGEGGRGQ